MLVIDKGETGPLVRVLPITHAPPTNPADALEIPYPTKQRLGLDSERSWVVLTEANDFIWPGPDLRPAVAGDLASVVFGVLPPAFFRQLRDRLIDRWRILPPDAVRRTE